MFALVGVGCASTSSETTQSGEVAELRSELGALRDEVEGLSAELAAAREALGQVAARVDELEAGANEPLDALEARVAELERQGVPSGVVVSTYSVDCSRVNLYAAYSEAYSARWAAGTLDGFESVYASCLLVDGIDPSSVPSVTVALETPVEVDVRCSGSGCSTQSDTAWINSLSGGQIYPGGYDDMRMSPGMQLRYDAERGTVYTASDLRFLTSGNTLPRVYRVHVVGDRAYTAPAGW